MNTLRPTSSHSAPPGTPYPDSFTSCSTSNTEKQSSVTVRSKTQSVDSERSLSADSLMSAVDSEVPFPPLTKSFVSFGSLDSTVLLHSEGEEGNYRISGSSNPGFLGSTNLRERAFSDLEKSLNIKESSNDLIDFSTDVENIPNCPVVSQPNDSVSSIVLKQHRSCTNESLSSQKLHCNPMKQTNISHLNSALQQNRRLDNLNSFSKPLLTPAEMYRAQFTAHLKSKAQSLPRQMNVDGKDSYGRSLNPSVVCLLVIGGKGSEAREIQRKSLDLWRCDIDTGEFIYIFIK